MDKRDLLSAKSITIYKKISAYILKKYPPVFDDMRTHTMYRKCIIRQKIESRADHDVPLCLWTRTAGGKRPRTSTTPGKSIAAWLSFALCRVPSCARGLWTRCGRNAGALAINTPSKYARWYYYCLAADRFRLESQVLLLCTCASDEDDNSLRRQCVKTVSAFSCWARTTWS